MATLTQPLAAFISEQIQAGHVTTELEAEQQILAEVARRELQRKLEHAEQLADNGEVKPLDEQFMDDFFARAKKRNGIA